MRDRLDLAMATLERRVLAEFRRVDDVEVSKIDRKQLAKSPAFHHSKALVLEDVNRRRDNYNALIGRRWRATTVGEAVHVQERDDGLNGSSGSLLRTPLKAPAGGGSGDADDDSAELFVTTDPTTPRQGAQAARDSPQPREGAPDFFGMSHGKAEDTAAARRFDDGSTPGGRSRQLRRPVPDRLHGRTAGADDLIRIAHRSLAELHGSPSHGGERADSTAPQLLQLDDLMAPTATVRGLFETSGAPAGNATEGSRSECPMTPSANAEMPRRMMTPPLSRRVLHQRKSDLYYGVDNRWDVPTQSEAEQALFNPLIAAAQQRRFGTRPLSAASTRSGSRPVSPSVQSRRTAGGASNGGSRPLSAASVLSVESPVQRPGLTQQHAATVKARAASTAPRRDMRDNIAFQLSSVQHRVQRRPVSSAGRR
jgi:hypothetical protein